MGFMLLSSSSGNQKMAVLNTISASTLMQQFHTLTRERLELIRLCVIDLLTQKSIILIET